MKQGAKILIGLLVLGVALSGAYLWWQTRQAGGGVLARITQNGQLLQEIRLDRVDAPYSFVVDHDGQSNTICVERGRIRISQANCPDHICVGQGWISSAVLPIVCLPHGLIIEAVGGEDVLDAVTG